MATYNSLTTYDQNEVLSHYQASEVFTDAMRKEQCQLYIHFCMNDGPLAGYPPDALLRSTIENTFTALDNAVQEGFISQYIGK